ncbi:MAG TPA: HAD family hydrolase [Candidatus Acidoferrales bacterium]|nr:HAD family hydrolase [Candidatus Acidoferrales bacterium]
MTLPRRAVVFDLDNTLILEDASTIAAIRVAAERCGLDGDAVATAVGETADRLWKISPVVDWADRFGIWWGEALWGGFSGDEPEMREMRAFAGAFRGDVWRGALERLGRRDGGLADRLSAAYIAARRAGETIDPEAEPALRDLRRDHGLALLTNGAGDVQREKLSRTPFAPYFDAVVISTEVGIGKPDPRIFARALAALDAAPGDATMVGDSLQRDIAGARSAGLRTIWLDRRLWHEKDVRPDARIERLSDLRAALDALERRPASPPARS